MKLIRLTVALALVSAAPSMAGAGFTVGGATGSIWGIAVANLHGTRYAVSDGGPFVATGPVIEQGASAMSRPTFSEAAIANGYAVVSTRDTTITLNGSTDALANSGSVDSSSSAEARLELVLRIDVDSRSMWRLPSGYAISNGGTSAYSLRRQGSGEVLFDSRADAWTAAAGILAPGAYEFVVECSSATSVAGGPGQDDVALSATAGGVYVIKLQIEDAPTGGPVADFNGDGFVDFSDFDAFVDAFDAGDLAADVTLDGYLDFTDFDTFVWVFEAGASG